jgi:hypothetical protein
LAQGGNFGGLIQTQGLGNGAGFVQQQSGGGFGPQAQFLDSRNATAQFAGLSEVGQLEGVPSRSMDQIAQLQAQISLLQQQLSQMGRVAVSPAPSPSFVVGDSSDSVRRLELLVQQLVFQQHQYQQLPPLPHYHASALHGCHMCASSDEKIRLLQEHCALLGRKLDEMEKSKK